MPRAKRDYSPIPGFPRREQFKSMAEIAAYFSGNTIQCLECGHWFRALPRHLKDHGINADEYKERHGIPWGRGLICGQLSETLRQFAVESGVVDRVKGRSLCGVKGPYRHYVMARKLAKMAYTEDDYYQVARRVAGGEPFLAVCRDPDVPSHKSVTEYRKKNVDFDKYWRVNVEPNMVAYRASARERLASGDVARAIEMLASGSSVAEVASATSFSPPMVRLIKAKKAYRIFQTDKDSDG